MMKTETNLCKCGGKIKILYFINSDTKQREPNVAVCQTCLKEYTVGG